MNSNNIIFKDGNSYVIREKFSEDLLVGDFNELLKSFDDQKEEKIVRFYGKEFKKPRFDIVYGDYKFNGSGNSRSWTDLDTNNLIDNQVVNFVDYIIKDLKFGKSIGMKSLQFEDFAAVVNLYQDGSHYIGYHSDDEKNLKQGAPIYCFSLGQSRDFLLKPKKNSQGVKSAKITLRNMDLIKMCGDLQKTHLHSIPKRSTNKCFNPRISFTFRIFK